MKILIIEDNPDHLELIEDLLHKMPVSSVKVSSETTLSGGVDKLMLEHFDLCLCDLQLPDSSIKNTIDWLSTTSVSIPIVTLTSLNSSEVAEGLLSKGVQDFIPKEELSSNLLFRSCRYAIERWKHQQIISEHNKDMKAFCSSLSHDFNGHISRIIGVSDAIKSDFENRFTFTEKDEKWFEFLNTSTKAIHHLVSSLQQYLSVEYAVKKFEKVSLMTIIEAAEESLKASANKSFTLEFERDMPMVLGNSSFLQLLFQNLIGNSIKFCEHEPRISITCSKSKNAIKVAIKDNGIGFDITKTDLMFRPFNRLENGSDTEGSGLGLSIVNRIIEHHEGQIEVDSKLDKGSTFSVSLPLAAGEAIQH